MPPNKHIELTVKSVTSFACAKAAPLFPAAHVWRWVAGIKISE